MDSARETTTTLIRRIVKGNLLAGLFSMVRNRHLFYFCCLAIVGIAIVLAIVSKYCDLESHHLKSVSTSQPSPDDSDGTSSLIRPGYGTERIHLGMAFDAVRQNLGDTDYTNVITRPDEPIYSIKGFRDEGILVSEENLIVWSITFYYKAKWCRAFDGGVAGGIDVNSTIADVRAAYGEPSMSRESRISEFGTYPNVREKTIEYRERGIGFRFIGENLSCAYVFAANSDSNSPP